MPYHSVLVKLSEFEVDIDKEITNYIDSYSLYKAIHKEEYEYLLRVKKLINDLINEYNNIITICNRERNI